MSISHYIKEIGRGKEGARALSREQALDLMGQILDGNVSDLELGAFCMAMRIKGETPQEMLGFLEAIHARINKVACPAQTQLPVIVMPSYNGSRRLPLLTPLLAGLLQRQGFSVLIHGHASEDQRVSCESVIQALGWPTASESLSLAPAQVLFINTRVLSAGLTRLLNIRRTIGLRNSGHSLAKLINPLSDPQKTLLITNFTHPEYEISMTQTLQNSLANALLLRGTEGEAVADPRRSPKMTGFVKGVSHLLQELSIGALEHIPTLPTQTDPDSTADYIQSVLSARIPCPLPILNQVQAVLNLSDLMNNDSLST
jgi:hypothetical protein